MNLNWLFVGDGPHPTSMAGRIMAGVFDMDSTETEEFASRMDSAIAGELSLDDAFAETAGFIRQRRGLAFRPKPDLTTVQGRVANFCEAVGLMCQTSSIPPTTAI